jgi:hypothetical protein
MVTPTQVDEDPPRKPADADAADAGVPAGNTMITGAGPAADDGTAQASAAGPGAADPAAADPAAAAPGGAEPGAGDAGLEVAGPEPRRDMSPLALIGIVVGVIALVGVAAGVLAVATHGFHKKTVLTYRPAAVFRLHPGECINSAPDGLAVTVLSCGTPHDAEVFATYSLPAAPWPGNAAIQQSAGNGCAARLGSYLKPALADAGLAQEYVYPNQDAWRAGERTVVCEVSSPTGKLTGSVRQGS